MADHVGGVAELKQKYNCRVVAPHDKIREKSPIVDLPRRQWRYRQRSAACWRGVLETPGHTLDHISLRVRRARKAACLPPTTLFSIGCGRVFEGTYPMMWDFAVEACAARCRTIFQPCIAAMNTPPPTVKFGASYGSSLINAALAGARRGSDPAARRPHKPTVPNALLGDEKKANVVPARRRSPRWPPKLAT